MEIQAYFEEWSRHPGDVVKMAISTRHASVRANLLRARSGPGKGENEVGRCDELPAVLDKEIATREYPTMVGSYAELPLPSSVATDTLTVHCWAFPTAPKNDAEQAIWSLGDLTVFLRGGHVHARSGAGLIARIEEPIEPSHWYSILLSLRSDGRELSIRRLDANAPRRSARIAAPVRVQAHMLTLASTGTGSSVSPQACFNGKIDSPTLYLDALPETAVAELHSGRPCDRRPWAHWRLGEDFGSETLYPGFPGGATGRLINGAERGVTGRNWDGRSDSFVDVPEQYCALQFHDDDMVDSQWPYDLEFHLPETLASGVYYLRLSAGGSANYFPLFVRGSEGREAPILLLLPTNTYLAYGNDHLAELDLTAIMAHEKMVASDEKYLFDHPAPGRSAYDTHSDGTPVRYSSRRRPLFNVRPHSPSWLTGSHRHYPVDMYLVEWLEHVGLEYHVATDEDLDRQGRALLDRYKVVVTGSHPEYWTRESLDVVKQYLGDGGRLMYLGGNGFYWVTTRFPERPWVVEIRRDNTGTRCWDAPYGERTHVASKEAGGLWRARGKAPNKLVGVGFCSQGFSKACGYRRLDASYNSPARKFFEGVESEIIGDQGFVLGGAVGDEIDRYDVSLGSPEHAYVLATSTGVGNEYQLVIEDLILTLPDQGGRQRPDKIRSDIVMFPVENGGCVFSVGSIAYAGALAWNECDNDLSRMTANVLRAFASADPVF